MFLLEVQIPLQLLHASNPPLVIIGLVLKKFAGFRMRQDHESLFGHGCYNIIGYLLRQFCAFHAARIIVDGFAV